MDRVILTDATVVTPQWAGEASVVVEEGRIAAILPDRRLPEGRSLAGQFLIPGLIDIHTDYLEREARPRSSADFPLSMAFHFMDLRAIGAGITTVLGAARISEPKERAQAGKDTASKDIPQNTHQNSHIEVPENAQKDIIPKDISQKDISQKDISQKDISQKDIIPKDIIGWNGDGLQLARAYQELRRTALARHYIHLRWDPNFEPVQDILAQLQQIDGIGNLVYNDSTPGERQFQNMEEQIQSLAFHRRISVEEARTHYERLRERGRTINNRAQVQTALADRLPLGSHDDATIDHVLEAHYFGATLAEMPVSLAAARKAKELGMAVCMGAPNYYRGGSHCGNLSSLDAMQEGLVDIFCSDFHFPAMLGAAMKMLTSGMDPVAVFRLFTQNPAQHLRLDQEIGSLTVGLKADLTAFHPRPDFGLVTHVWVEGQLRFHATPQD